MERTFESAAALVSRAAGPLASYLGAFASSLIDHQFAASVVYIKARHALAFDRWLRKRGVVLADLSDAHIEHYQRRTRRRHQCIRDATRYREYALLLLAVQTGLRLSELTGLRQRICIWGPARTYA